MPQPLGNAFSARINELGGEDWVFAEISDGRTIQSIADQVGCSRSWLSSVWMKGPGRKDKLKEARKESAPLVFDDAGKILDDISNLPTAELTPARVQIGRARAEHQQKRAAFLDPETYGDKPAIQIGQLNVADLHLDALRRFGRVETIEATPVVEALPGPTTDEAA